ncbi:OLC1v1035272C1 [Oldenlandia corymbosa var. corymbosa]|uniref:OLC1v1035272C1 n=1 Tax=Oldenlandia corymbosa var. corymbosa TaxID=529605 RepID=A0AAV1CTB6_OLDCO|nr:OLC1v1035272C1 [Oldenlandia corymbosa var. corymbosa]
MDLTYCPKIRLFRWNEKLVDKKNMLQDYSQGLCLFDIIDTTVYRTHRPDSRNSEIRKSLDRRCDCVTTSDLGRLLSAAEDDDDDQDRLSELITELVTGTALFSPETAAELGIQISTHFTNDYQLRKRTETQLSPVFYSVTCKGNHHHHEDEDSDKEDEECTEEWAQDDVRWYDYSDEAVAYWIRLRNYLGEPKHDNLLTRAIIRDEPRGLWEIPPTSLVPHRQRGIIRIEEY